MVLPFLLLLPQASPRELQCQGHSPDTDISSLGSSKLVIIGGLAELFSGAISMGLGAYLAAVTDRDHYLSEERREHEEVVSKPEDEKMEIFEIMESYGIGREATTPLVEALAKNPDEWVRVSLLGKS